MRIEKRGCDCSVCVYEDGASARAAPKLVETGTVPREGLRNATRFAQRFFVGFFRHCSQNRETMTKTGHLKPAARKKPTASRRRGAARKVELGFWIDFTTARHLSKRQRMNVLFACLDKAITANGLLAGGVGNNLFVFSKKHGASANIEQRSAVKEWLANNPRIVRFRVGRRVDVNK